MWVATEPLSPQRLRWALAMGCFWTDYRNIVSGGIVRLGLTEGWRASSLLSLLSSVLCCSQSALWHIQSPSFAGIVLIGHWESPVPCPAAWHVIGGLIGERSRRALAYRTWSRQSRLLEAWESGEATGHLKRVYKAWEGGRQSPLQP